MYVLCVLIVISCLLPLLFYGFWAFDQLVRLEHTSYREQWEQDGRPHGFFWGHREAQMSGGLMVGFGSTFAFQRCAFTWLFSTPEWAKKDRKALDLLYRFRVAVASWDIGVLFILTPLLMFMK